MFTSNVLNFNEKVKMITVILTSNKCFYAIINVVLKHL